jgi:hypothetical protein
MGNLKQLGRGSALAAFPKLLQLPISAWKARKTLSLLPILHCNCSGHADSGKLPGNPDTIPALSQTWKMATLPVTERGIYQFLPTAYKRGRRVKKESPYRPEHEFFLH